ncbi:MAG: tyrosine-protein phosphatase [Clostridia bacterium]|nr:tyrosine-protein phosphatase [Clostridia bacterium]
MKNRFKTALAIVLTLCMLTSLLAGCGAGKEKISGRGIMHEEEFGGVYIDLSIEDFNALGFIYGDSVDVSFSNGYEMKGLPYYNGYYTQTGEPLLVAYPGYPYIKVCVNNGDDLWDLAALKDGDKANISLAEQGKFLDIQNARDIHYEDDRSLFASDAVFANFRCVSAGSMKDGVLYRSASPCDNQHNRAGYVNDLIAEAGVKYIVNLSDNDEKIQGYIGKEDFRSPYFLSLYERGDVIPLALNMNFSSDDFKAKVVAGFTAMTEHEGPYLVHCTEGKDRTGFVCMLLEMLCGATYQEIVDDYMITYDNYYRITKEKDPARYTAIVDTVLVPMMQSVVGEGGADPAEADLAGCAESFLKNAGMTGDAVNALRARLMK